MFLYHARRIYIYIYILRANEFDNTTAQSHRSTILGMRYHKIHALLSCYIMSKMLHRGKSHLTRVFPITKYSLNIHEQVWVWVLHCLMTTGLSKDIRCHAWLIKLSILFSVLTNHQIRHHAAHWVGCRHVHQATCFEYFFWYKLRSHGQECLPTIEVISNVAMVIF